MTGKRRPLPSERPTWFWAVWAVATVLLLIGLVRLLGGYADNIWFTLPALVLFAGAHFALRLRNKSSKTDEPARPAKGRGK